MSFLLEKKLNISLPPDMQNQLKTHVLQIQKTQDYLMKSKLSQEKDKQNKIKLMQHNFNNWIQKKANDYYAKLQQVQKNKNSYIAKIIKKCKDRDKIVTKKQNDYIKSRKKSLNAAWKKASQFNDDIQKYYQSKYVISKTQESNSNSIFYATLNHPEYGENESKRRKLGCTNPNPNFLQVMNNTSVNSTYSENALKSLRSQVNKNKKMDEMIIKEKKKKSQKQISAPSQNNENTKQWNQNILLKMQEIDKLNEEIKIQELSKKLQKIQQTRFRRIKNHEKKIQKNGDDQGKNSGHETCSLKKLPKKSKKEKDFIYRHEPHKRQPRIKNRSQQVKLRRQEMFEQHLAQGEDYLSNVKIRHLKNIITKQITYNALEKKLYQERLHS